RKIVAADLTHFALPCVQGTETHNRRKRNHNKRDRAIDPDPAARAQPSGVRPMHMASAHRSSPATNPSAVPCPFQPPMASGTRSHLLCLIVAGDATLQSTKTRIRETPQRRRNGHTTVTPRA